MRGPKPWCYDSVLAAKPPGSLQLWGNPPGAGVRMSNAVADTMSLQWAAMPWELAGDRCLHRQGSLRNMCRGAVPLCQAGFLVASVFLCVLIMRSVAGEPSVMHVATPNANWVGGVSRTGYNLAAKSLKLQVKSFADICWKAPNQSVVGREDNQSASFGKRLGQLVAHWTSVKWRTIGANIYIYNQYSRNQGFPRIKWSECTDPGWPFVLLGGFGGNRQEVRPHWWGFWKLREVWFEWQAMQLSESEAGSYSSDMEDDEAQDVSASQAAPDQCSHTCRRCHCRPRQNWVASLQWPEKKTSVQLKSTLQQDTGLARVIFFYPPFLTTIWILLFSFIDMQDKSKWIRGNTPGTVSAECSPRGENNTKTRRTSYFVLPD